MTKEQIAEYGLKAGIPQQRIEKGFFIPEGWDDEKVKAMLDSIGQTFKANQLNPTTDYTDATLKQRMEHELAGKSEAQLKKEADDIAGVIVNGH